MKVPRRQNETMPTELPTGYKGNEEPDEEDVPTFGEFAVMVARFFGGTVLIIAAATLVVSILIVAVVAVKFVLGLI